MIRRKHKADALLSIAVPLSFLFLSELSLFSYPTILHDEWRFSTKNVLIKPALRFDWLRPFSSSTRGSCPTVLPWNGRRRSYSPACSNAMHFNQARSCFHFAWCVYPPTQEDAIHYQQIPRTRVGGGEATMIPGTIGLTRTRCARTL